MSEPRKCGCPECAKRYWCPACHGTGRIPPLSHPPVKTLPWSNEIACEGKHDA